MNAGNISPNLTRALPGEPLLLFTDGELRLKRKESPRTAVMKTPLAMIQLPLPGQDTVLFDRCLSPQVLGQTAERRELQSLGQQPSYFRRQYSKCNWTEALSSTNKMGFGYRFEDKLIFTSGLLLLTKMYLLHQYGMLCWCMMLVSFPKHEHHC